MRRKPGAQREMTDKCLYNGPADSRNPEIQGNWERSARDILGARPGRKSKPVIQGGSTRSGKWHIWIDTHSRARTQGQRAVNTGTAQGRERAPTCNRRIRNSGTQEQRTAESATRPTPTGVRRTTKVPARGEVKRDTGPKKSSTRGEGPRSADAKHHTFVFTKLC